MQHQYFISLSINPSETLATHPSVWRSTDVGVLDYTAHDRAWRWPDKAVCVLTQPDAKQSSRWIALKVVGGGVNMAFYSLLPHVTQRALSATVSALQRPQNNLPSKLFMLALKLESALKACDCL